MPLVAVIALGAWAAFHLGSGKGNSATALATTEQVVQATTGTMSQTVSATGTVAAAQTDNLSFASAGTVTAVDVAAGDKVKAGQVLATIDSASLAAAVSDAQASLAQAQAKLADDTAAGASSAQLSADSTGVTSAQDKVSSAQAALAGAQLVATFDGTVASVNLTVGEQLGGTGTGGTSATGSGSGSGLSSSTLGSGQTSQRGGGAAGSGSAAGSGGSSGSTAQIQVVSQGSFTVALGFDATNISKVQVGQVATIALSTAPTNNRGFGGFGGFGGLRAGGDLNGGATSGRASGAGGAGNGGTGGQTTPGATVQGLVTSVGRVATATSGVATFPVTVAFDDTTGQFNAGATVSAAIAYAQVADAVQVPARAITQGDSGATVVVADGTARTTRDVTTGLTANGMVQITSGLRAGESVVVTVPNFRAFARTTGRTTGGQTRTGAGG